MEVGDVVRLKSGGPRMTIASIEMVFARCVWFPDHYGEGHLQELLIRLACLEVEPRDEEAEDDVARRERELDEAGAAGARIVPTETAGLGRDGSWITPLRVLHEQARAELQAAMEAEALATGPELFDAVQRRLRAEDVEARLSEEPGTF